MSSIRINQFAGLTPTVNPKALKNDFAQIAHNCLLMDGWLWPMPKWIIDKSSTYNKPLSLFKDKNKANGYDFNSFLKSAVKVDVEPFNDNKVSGIAAYNGCLTTYEYVTDWMSNLRHLGVPAPKLSIYAPQFQITPMHKSVYPISRTYAMTYVCGDKEGPPIVFQQIGTGGTLFEGDIVTIGVIFAYSVYDDLGITGIKLYRTVPGFDTSEELGNPVETGFHYVGNIPLNSGYGGTIYVYFVDDKDSSQIPGDLLISDQWIPPLEASDKLPIYYGLTEGGWFVNVRHNGTYGGAVQFSERFMNHAWPMQNTFLIPDDVTGVAIFYDNVFIGTSASPYHVSVEVGEQEALNTNVRAYVDDYACIPNSMVATNFGAMYASRDGLVALTNNALTLASKNVVAMEDQIPVIMANGSIFNTTVAGVNKAGWWNGNYYGFFTDPFNSQGFAYLYNQPSPANNDFPLGQLVTIDLPSPFVVDTIATGNGFFAAFGTGYIYRFPLPGYGYEVAPKARYTWKSKRFVMSGLTTFAGMKVINSNNGDLIITLNGFNDGAETVPSFVYSRTLNHSKPFRLPHNHKCLEWEIQAVGTAVIQEIHLSTSYQDLIEESNVNVSASA